MTNLQKFFNTIETIPGFEELELFPDSVSIRGRMSLANLETTFDVRAKDINRIREVCRGKVWYTLNVPNGMNDILVLTALSNHEDSDEVVDFVEVSLPYKKLPTKMLEIQRYLVKHPNPSHYKREEEKHECGPYCLVRSPDLTDAMRQESSGSEESESESEKESENEESESESESESEEEECPCERNDSCHGQCRCKCHSVCKKCNENKMDCEC